MAIIKSLQDAETTQDMLHVHADNNKAFAREARRRQGQDMPLFMGRTAEFYDGKAEAFLMAAALVVANEFNGIEHTTIKQGVIK